MQRSPEALVAKLRNKKSRIILYSILSLLFLGSLVFYLCVLSHASQSLIPKEGEEPTVHNYLLPVMLQLISALITMSMLIAAGLGISIGSLYVEFTSFTKNELLVQLWDRVQELEKTQQSLAKSQTISS
jgi:hypothetical protein